jgi:hypothetical protein
MLSPDEDTGRQPSGGDALQLRLGQFPSRAPFVADREIDYDLVAVLSRQGSRRILVLLYFVGRLRASN